MSDCTIGTSAPQRERVVVEDREIFRVLDARVVEKYETFFVDRRLELIDGRVFWQRLYCRSPLWKWFVRSFPSPAEAEREADLWRALAIRDAAVMPIVEAMDGRRPRGNWWREKTAEALVFGRGLSRKEVIPAAGSPDPCGPGTAGLARRCSGACAPIREGQDFLRRV
jgi:hypothetical protein